MEKKILALKGNIRKVSPAISYFRNISKWRLPVSLFIACVWADAHGPSYGQQMALIIAISGLRTLAIVSQCHPRRKEERNKRNRGREGKGERQISQGSVTKRSTQKIICSSSFGQCLSWFTPTAVAKYHRLGNLQTPEIYFSQLDGDISKITTYLASWFLRDPFLVYG